MRFARLAALTTFALPLLAAATPAPLAAGGVLVCCGSYTLVDSSQPATLREEIFRLVRQDADIVLGVEQRVRELVNGGSGFVGLDCTMPLTETIAGSGSTCAAHQQPATCTMVTVLGTDFAVCVTGDVNV
ncbi:hypothetical protein BDW22DRAFT_1349618 [Trametopsis cervina]|nr:hypothetical protein BDW22DRAFT_1349618 [Trametopsis cervina]